MRLVAHFGLAFAAARLRLTSPLRITSRLIMQKARGQAFRSKLRHSPPTACRYTVSGTISLPSQGFFSPFPHGTGSLSVTKEYLALRDGPRGFSRDFTCPAILRVPVGVHTMSSTGLSPSLADRSRSFDYSVDLSLRVTGPTTPSCKHDGLGWSAFARRY